MDATCLCGELESRQLDHQESRGHCNYARDMQNLREGMLHTVHRGERDTLGLADNPNQTAPRVAHESL